MCRAMSGRSGWVLCYQFADRRWPGIAVIESAHEFEAAAGQTEFCTDVFVPAFIENAGRSRGADDVYELGGLQPKVQVAEHHPDAHTREYHFDVSR